ncbi:MULTISPECIES: hypothetical protein [Streptomyces]|uniref:hypothetical protein n=1 Tax=Streptomyces TaxID=1883 RepID=UPI0005946853|nr:MULTISPECIES: hypothetical protein [Streptomyces]MYS63451.1 hypothetical protein [Streptomyces sp. SID5473]TAI42580.1 hypothetical protein EWI31_19285 [Streptomyces tsukubensis]
MRVRTAVTGLVAAACAGVLMSPATAVAAPQAERESHCINNSGTQTTTCYGTFREAVAAVTGSRVTDVPTQAKAGKDKQFINKLNASIKSSAAKKGSFGAANQANYIRVILFEDANYGGSSYINYGPGGCRDDGFWNGHHDNLSQVNFNDRTSSLKTASNCYVELFSAAYFQGARQFYTADTSYVGNAMNDQASSFGLT